MALKLNIREFVIDYCEGVNDRELLAKYKLSAKDMVGLVRKLINEGRITKDQYFERSSKIKERESRQEKAFLKSLYNCSICGHIQPTPFSTCPACGTDVSEAPETSKYTSALHGITVVADMPEPPQPFEDEMPSAMDMPAPTTTSEIQEPTLEIFEEITPPVAVSQGAPAPEPVAPLESPARAPKAAMDMLGVRLEQPTQVPGIPPNRVTEDFEVQEIITSGMQSTIFKAASPSGSAPPVVVKMFLSEAVPGDALQEVVSRTIYYQSAMTDPNVVTLLGSGLLNGVPVLLYEYLPTNIEMALQNEPEGLPLDLVFELLPQILNGLGYSHMHIGKDGAPSRVPHVNLRLSKFLYDAATKVVKLEGCGVWRALVDTRGFKRHLWEEPGIDIGGLPPEAFVQESRFVNAFQVDMYQLGATLYRMVTGTVPFAGKNFDDYRLMHLRKFPIPPKVHRYTIPGWLDGMILKCLEKEPTKRWRSATQMELAIGKGLPE